MINRSIFVVGVPRSGTTLVATAIRNLPKSCGLPPMLRKLEDKRFPLARCFVKEIIARISNRQKHQKPHNGGDFWDKVLREHDRKLVQELLHLSAFSAPGDAEVFVNKKISNVHHLRAIAECFPNPTLVHVHRDPCDTVMSILGQRRLKLGSESERWGVMPEGLPHVSADPVVDCCNQYRGILGMIEQSKDLFPSMIAISYEEFCEDPLRELNRVGDKVSRSTDLDLPPIRYKTYDAPSDFVSKVRKNIGEDIYAAYCKKRS